MKTAEQDPLESCQILVVGAGGLGCEILKNLATSGFKNITVVDMDSIEVTNLNRQFLFSDIDVGKPKATVSAEKINSKFPHINIEPVCARIEELSREFYQRFNLIICGLDSIEARRWINSYIVKLNSEESSDTAIPIVDGGVEGLMGQARVIIPRISSCYECTVDLNQSDQQFPICTISNTPRLPEHCIEWAFMVEWSESFQDSDPDLDNLDHISWIYEAALKRAEKFGISGVTFELTENVIKRSIPSLASTNAVIAGLCTNEAYKLVIGDLPLLDNFLMYNGNSGIFTQSLSLEKDDQCPVCSTQEHKLPMPHVSTLQDLLDKLKGPEYNLVSPSIWESVRLLYTSDSITLEEKTRPNLAKCLKDLFPSGTSLVAIDDASSIELSLVVIFQS